MKASIKYEVKGAVGVIVLKTNFLGGSVWWRELWLWYPVYICLLNKQTDVDQS